MVQKMLYFVHFSQLDCIDSLVEGLVLVENSLHLLLVKLDSTLTLALEQGTVIYCTRNQLNTGPSRSSISQKPPKGKSSLQVFFKNVRVCFKFFNECFEADQVFAGIANKFLSFIAELERILENMPNERNVHFLFLSLEYTIWMKWDQQCRVHAVHLSL